MARLTLKDLDKIAPWAQEQVRKAMQSVQPSVTSPAPPRKRQPKLPANPLHFHGVEKDLQKQVEVYLDTIGFSKRTAKVITTTQGRGGALGWQVHISRAIGNPYVLDILLLSHSGRYLELELKTATGTLSDLQRLLTNGNVCRSLDEVKEAVNRWLNCTNNTTHATKTASSRAPQNAAGHSKTYNPRDRFFLTPFAPAPNGAPSRKSTLILIPEKPKNKKNRKSQK